MHTSVLWSWEKGRGRNARIDLSSGLPQVAKPLQRFQGCSQSCVLAILSSEQTLHDVAAGLFFPFPSLQTHPYVQSGEGVGSIQLICSAAPQEQATPQHQEVSLRTENVQWIVFPLEYSSCPTVSPLSCLRLKDQP